MRSIGLFNDRLMSRTNRTRKAHAVRRTTLLLFDIDGTLLLSGGASFRALTRAFKELFGVSDGFTGIPVAGRTDALILDDAIACADLQVSDGTRARFHARYGELLEREIRQPGSRKGLLPGVARLLDTLAERPDACSALLTGNFARAARIKLEYFGLWRYFECGAFGDDAPERNQLTPIALERARAAGVEVTSFADVVVIGDTPLDVECAATVGARSLAVATGSYDQAALRESGADAVLPDLSDAQVFLDFLGP